MASGVLFLAHDVAQLLRDRPFTRQTIEAALVAVRGAFAVDLTRLAAALALRFPAGAQHAPRNVAAYLASSRRFARLFGDDTPTAEQPRVGMLPTPGAPRTWNVPAITTVHALAEWLGVSDDRLRAWCRTFRPDPERRDSRLHPYHCRWIARRNAPPRLLEAPKVQLKAAQRRILTGILAHIPPHAAAHGFVARRSVGTFTAPHVGTACLLRLDVQDFFASIGHVRVRRIFATAGYPPDVATMLTALCTTASPRHTLAALAEHGTPGALLAERLRQRHLPQGAPTSPALANLAAFGLDARLTGLARRFHASYTRYADDLLFSGDAEFARSSTRCATWVAAVLLQEGFTAAHRKTRRMRQGTAQHAGGRVLNVHAAVPRRERDRLHAILVNCVRHGPSTQNRDGHADFRAHLRGRIGHVADAHPPHAAPLLAQFAQIDWCR